LCGASDQPVGTIPGFGSLKHEGTGAPKRFATCRRGRFRHTFFMALIVHKYGGTSMGSTERIRNVAKRVAKWARAGHQMVVPSAMSGETNRLLALAKELSPERATRPPPRAGHDRRHRRAGSVGLLAMALQAEGMEAVSYTGWQVPIRTDSHTKARIEASTTSACVPTGRQARW
jgi:aspartokinase